MQWDPKSPNYLLVGCRSGRMHMYDVDSSQQLQSFEQVGQILPLANPPLLARILSLRASPPCPCVLSQPPPLPSPHPQLREGGLQMIAWVPNVPGDFVTVSNKTGVIRVWNVSNRQSKDTLKVVCSVLRAPVSHARSNASPRALPSITLDPPSSRPLSPLPLSLCLLPLPGGVGPVPRSLLHTGHAARTLPLQVWRRRVVRSAAAHLVDVRQGRAHGHRLQRRFQVGRPQHAGDVLLRRLGAHLGHEAGEALPRSHRGGRGRALCDCVVAS